MYKVNSMILYYSNMYIEFFSTLLIVFGFSFIFCGICFIFPFTFFSLDKTIGYECGFDPFSDARDPFSIKFYLISILFILFDIEIVFFFPWSLCLYILSFMGYYIMYVFYLILVFGYIYECKKHCLDFS